MFRKQTGMLNRAFIILLMLLVETGAYALLHHEERPAASIALSEERGKAAHSAPARAFLRKQDTRKTSLSGERPLLIRSDILRGDLPSSNLPSSIEKRSRSQRSAPLRSAGTRAYRVRPGDTLFAIARRLGVSVPSLCEANRISDDTPLRAGQRLRIPGSRSGGNSLKQSSGAEGHIPDFRPEASGGPRFAWPLRAIRDIRRDGESGVRPIGIVIESRPGAPVLSSARGVVERVGTMRGFGQYVIINHGGHYLTVYSRMDSISVSEGDTVGRGKVIGSQGGMLHFQINRSGRPLNPLELLPGRG